MKDYSTKQVNQKLVQEVIDALKNVKGWGSVEIFVQDYEVVQIVERNIKKTYHNAATIAATKVKS